MESYQPWPIFNVQNELAGVQKKKKKKEGVVWWCGGLQFKSGEWYMAIFFREWLSCPPTPQPYCNLPPPYQPPQTPLPAHTTFNYHITPDLFFLSKAWQACSWGGGLKVKVHVCTDLCVRIHVCLNASIYEDTLHSSVGPELCMFSVYVGREGYRVSEVHPLRFNSGNGREMILQMELHETVISLGH